MAITKEFTLTATFEVPAEFDEADAERVRDAIIEAIHGTVEDAEGVTTSQDLSEVDDGEMVHTYDPSWCPDCEGPCFYTDWLGE